MRAAGIDRFDRIATTIEQNLDVIGDSVGTEVYRLFTFANVVVKTGRPVLDVFQRFKPALVGVGGN